MFDKQTMLHSRMLIILLDKMVLINHCICFDKVRSAHTHLQLSKNILKSNVLGIA